MALYSTRFQRPVILTRHASLRMAERHIADDLVLRIIDTGTTKRIDDTRLWIWLEVAGRDDNLLCVAIVLEHAVIVKTVMHHWELLP